MNFDSLKKFNAQIIKSDNTFDKVRVASSDLLFILELLKNDERFAFDRLNTIIAVDLGLEVNQFELIYDLHSIKNAQSVRVSILVDRNVPKVPSIVGIFKSAYFDECETYDLFGIIFENNPDLKRLLMPKGWIGYPLRKDYKQEDERLLWSEK